MDDGAPGEGLSDLVVGTIVFNLSTVTRLFGEMDTDLNFHRYVMKHIDATCDTRELRAVLTR